MLLSSSQISAATARARGGRIDNSFLVRRVRPQAGSRWPGQGPVVCQVLAGHCAASATMSFSRQSRFMRSMTPSGSVKMSTSRFNLVCGKTVEQATRPNLDRIPNPEAPKILDARVLTPSLGRRELGLARERGRSQERTSYGRPPLPPARDSSLYVPFGSYAERGIHSRPGR